MLVARDIGRNFVKFHEQQVVTFKIPAKILLKGEQRRVSMRIFETFPNSGRYKLIC